mgnify:CR=1 FL=1
MVGESAHGFPLEGGGGRRHSVPVGGASWDRHDDHWPEPHSPTATPRSRVHNHTVAQVSAMVCAVHGNRAGALHGEKGFVMQACRHTGSLLRGLAASLIPAVRRAC